MIDLIHDFETRIRILSRNLRSEISPKEVIGTIINHHASTRVLELDGRTDIKSLWFDESSEEFVVQGRKGPSTWVGKYLAEKFQSERVHLSWLSIDWERGSVIYCCIDGELQVEVK